MFYADWKFLSDNEMTSQEVYIAIFEQRLQEGFIFISSFNKMKFNTVHFIKIVESKKTKHYNKVQDSQFLSKRKNSMHSVSSAKVGLRDARRNLKNRNIVRLSHKLLSNDHPIIEQTANKWKKLEEEAQSKSIVLQYIMKFDQAFHKSNKGKFCLRSLLLMEKEACFFLFKKKTIDQDTKFKNMARRGSIHSNISQYLHS